MIASNYMTVRPYGPGGKVVEIPIHQRVVTDALRKAEVSSDCKGTIRQMVYSGGNIPSTAAAVELAVQGPLQASAALQTTMKYSSALMAVTGTLNMMLSAGKIEGAKRDDDKGALRTGYLAFLRGAIEATAGLILAASRTLTLLSTSTEKVQSVANTVGQVGTSFALGSYAFLGLLGALQVRQAVSDYRRLAYEGDAVIRECYTISEAEWQKMEARAVIAGFKGEEPSVKHTPENVLASRDLQRVKQSIAKWQEVLGADRLCSDTLVHEVVQLYAKKRTEFISRFGIEALQATTSLEAVELAMQHNLKKAIFYTVAVLTCVMAIVAFSLLTWGSGAAIPAAAGLLITVSILMIFIDGKGAYEAIQNNPAYSHTLYKAIALLSLFTIATTIIAAVVFTPASQYVLAVVIATGVLSLASHATIGNYARYKSLEQKALSAE